MKSNETEGKRNGAAKLNGTSYSNVNSDQNGVESSSNLNGSNHLENDNPDKFKDQIRILFVHISMKLLAIHYFLKMKNLILLNRLIKEEE